MDFYKILGVEKTASDAEIKKAYKKLAIKYHPDRSKEKEAEARFKEISTAYEILSDPEKRKLYDQGKLNQQAQFQHADFDPFSIFDQLFGGSPFGSRSPFESSRGSRGRDLAVQFQLDLEDLLVEKEHSLTITVDSSCKYCGGNGLKPGTKPQKCVVCSGTGTRIIRQGFLTIQQTCSACQGQGSKPAKQDYCTYCTGTGNTVKDKTITFKTPPGFPEGATLKLTGQGPAGKNGGPAGDVYLQISIKEHLLFKRTEHNLIFELPISTSEAILGCSKEIVHLNHSVRTIQIPPGTQSGDLITLKGEGLPRFDRRGTGDLVIKIKVIIPKFTNSDLITNLQAFEKANKVEEIKQIEDKINKYKQA